MVVLLVVTGAPMDAAAQPDLAVQAKQYRAGLARTVKIENRLRGGVTLAVRVCLCVPCFSRPH